VIGEKELVQPGRFSEKFWDLVKGYFALSLVGPFLGKNVDLVL
jgi:hypothetical protein